MTHVVARRLEPGEIDHELVWLSASLVSLTLAVAWFALGFPWPQCGFHSLTGLPCITCGMTRCAIQFFHGHFLAAFQWNPLIFTVLCAVLLFDLYAFAVLITRAPRLRVHVSSPGANKFVRVSIIFVLVLNWSYLLVHWRKF